VARHCMWDLISSERAGRAYVVTTHQMEEAGALCNRIAIMVNGALSCIGSAQHLKSKFGGSYQVELRTRDDSTATVAAAAPAVSAAGAAAAAAAGAVAPPPSSVVVVAPAGSADAKAAGGAGAGAAAGSSAVARVMAFVSGMAPAAVLLECFGGRVRYAIPRSAITLSRLFGEIQRMRAPDQLDIRDYSISQTTLEQVRAAAAARTHVCLQC
jgi:ABC-type glutathione transport system ATPase component